jgi:hypothetical protein
MASTKMIAVLHPTHIGCFLCQPFGNVQVVRKRPKEHRGTVYLSSAIVAIHVMHRLTYKSHHTHQEVTDVRFPRLRSGLCSHLEAQGNVPYSF